MSLAAAVLLACAPDSLTTPGDGYAGPPEPGIQLDLVLPGDTEPFVPLSASAACVAGGKAEQILLPSGFAQTVVAREGAGFENNADMLTLNESGPQKGRYLYSAHENGSNAAVSETDLETGLSRIVVQRPDLERFDGLAWTPWGTIIVAEETDPAGQKDPTLPNTVGGLVYEIDPATGVATPRPAVGSRSHEGLRFDKQGNLYGISEASPGYVFKFVPDNQNDLSSGQLYALKIVNDLGDRTGVAEWVALDRDAAQVNSQAEATAKGATGYVRPEDIEIGTSSGNDTRGNHVLYVAVTGEDRVLAIDLQPEGGPQGQAIVSDYVREGVNAPADFDLPDNLALDQHGNLYITEDPGGSAPSKTLGDDVWFAPFNPDSPTRSLPIRRFFSITDCNAEPTGIYVSPSGKTLFVNIQHRGGSDPRDLTIAVWRLKDMSFSRASQ
ncbi:MAG TPA: alkaline phosphatase PhoX [Gemmatimonadaceae bacterium]|nr:alkaline phosphatase PhoX [Gemmatimonadaceae bacterium]